MLRFVREKCGTKTFDGVDITLNSTRPGDKDSFTIGRALSSDLVIALPSLSREHCKFTFHKNNWFLEDSSSTGTWVNDNLLLKNEPRELNDGDIITLSTDSLIYEFKSLPCVGLAQTIHSLHSTPLYSTPLKAIEVNSKKLLNIHQLSTPDCNIKENATLYGFVPESQLKVLAAEEAEKRLKGEQRYAADLQAQKDKYEEELKQVNTKLQLAEQRESLSLEKQGEWKHEKELLTNDLEKQKNQLKEVRDEYGQQIEDAKHKLQLEVERWEKESQISSDLKEKLKEKAEDLEHLSDEYCNRLKEKVSILEENRLLVEENNRLKEEVKRLTEALELSSSEVTTLKSDKGTLTKTVDDLRLNLVAVEATKNIERANQLQTFEELMESELQCAICTEIVFNAQTLVCGHTFCQLCIDEWKEKNPHCPNCRKKVKRTYPSKVLDNFVVKMVDNLTVDFKRKRDQIVVEKDEHVAYKRMRLAALNIENPSIIVIP